MKLVEEILKKRGYATREQREAFLNPDYAGAHDPFLLPDMRAAVERLKAARKKQEHITIYGDYDIDGLTATTVLLDALGSFGFTHVDAFIPNRFTEGYGLTVEAVEKVAAAGATLMITVDCGSLSTKEIERANELGMDVIVTDHHNVLAVQPPAVAVINPKRLLQEHTEAYRDLLLVGSDKTSSGAAASRQEIFKDASLSAAELAGTQTSSPSQDASLKISGLNGAPEESYPEPDLYPFLDLPGVGVAFKLVQALQTELDGLPKGHEKWLLDLVALGTVCDVVNLVDENRAHVYWGLKVLAKTRRPGLRALMAVAGVEPRTVSARSLGFALGPRMNAAGRLETAQIALDMLTTKDPQVALQKAEQLDAMNKARRAEQDVMLEQALQLAQQYVDDDVLVVSSPEWNQGIIGIVAAKLLERFAKPTYVLAEIGEETKGSARSFGDFSAADAIRAANDIITKGGGHKAAAGVTLPTENIAAFRQRVNEHYEALKLERQADKLLAVADADALFADVTEELVNEIAQLEPFGNANPQPVIKSAGVVQYVRRMGSDGQHVKLTVRDADGDELQLLAFSAPEHFFADTGTEVQVWYEPNINEWQGRRSVEGRLVRLETQG